MDIHVDLSADEEITIKEDFGGYSGEVEININSEVSRLTLTLSYIATRALFDKLSPYFIPGPEVDDEP